MTSPSLRKPFGIILILLIVAIWAGIVASASPWIGRLPALVQAIVYLIAGIVWIVPMGPILRWMEGGKRA